MEAKILSAMDWEIKYHQPTDHNIPKLLKYRLGSYNITNTSPISDDQIVRTVASALERTPIKDDSTRIVILLGKEHIAFTEMVRTVAASKKSMKKKAARIQVLSKAFGTVWLHSPRGSDDTDMFQQILFYTDLSPRPQIAVEGSEGPPTYKKPVRKLAHKAVLRQEYLVWDELEKKGFGVNLQHFNPGVDKFIDERWGVPKEWRLSAQLLFGGVERTVSYTRST